jgi:hypothetical protein
MCANPFAWWKTHEVQILKVGFLAQQVFKILEFHIEIKRVLNLVGVLTTQRCFCLQVQNLDRMIIVVNSQPNDLHLHFTPNANLKDYLKTKVSLVEDNYELIKKELNILRSYTLTRIR